MTVSTDMNKPKCSGKAQLFLILRQRGSSPMGPEWQEYIQCDDPVTSHILLVTIKVSSTGLVPEWTPLPPSTLLRPTRRPITDMTFCKRDSVHSQVIEPWRLLAPSGLGLNQGQFWGCRSGWKACPSCIQCLCGLPYPVAPEATEHQRF